MTGGGISPNSDAPLTLHQRLRAAAEDDPDERRLGCGARHAPNWTDYLDPSRVLTSYAKAFPGRKAAATTAWQAGMSHTGGGRGRGRGGRPTVSSASLPRLGRLHDLRVDAGAARLDTSRVGGIACSA